MRRQVFGAILLRRGQRRWPFDSLRRVVGRQYTFRSRST